MLVIDDNMFRLAKMLEALLKVSAANREENLEKYKKTVLEIDSKAFADILEEIKHIDEHNHSLENELEFLERIKNAYDQLLELQSSFRRVCELYGNSELKLSDLSRLNIEYIEERINAIKGYLLNLKNIEVNKVKLQKLSEQLVTEEKKKSSLDSKLLEMETALRNNFIDAEGRYIVNGELQYASVISEYKNLGFDFRALLDDRVFLESMLSELENKKSEVAESVRAAEICYNSILSADSKQVLNEINRDFLKVKYELTLLKILKLLTYNFVNYDDFINKREQLQDLIKYRLSCMTQLGIKVSIDPFTRTKVSEQLETVLSIADNSKVINIIRKEISALNSRTEQMLKQNNNYLISLSDTRSLIESKIGLNDIDIASVKLPFDELIVEKKVAQNQVVDVRVIPNTLNMGIVGQKTASVIKRVNQLMDGSLHKKEEPVVDLVPEMVVVPPILEETKVEEPSQFVLPEFVVPELSVSLDDSMDDDEEELDDLDDQPDEEDKVVDQLTTFVPEVPPVVEEVAPVVDYVDIFETVTPFDEPLLFADRTDNSAPEVPAVADVPPVTVVSDIVNTNDNNNSDLQLDDTSTAFPEAFWVTQEDSSINDEFVEDDNGLSFDDQINKLLSSEKNTKSDSKTKRRVA